MLSTGNVIENLDVLGLSSAFMSPDVVSNISAYLEDHGITNVFVSDRIGMSPQALGMTLNGKRRMSATEYIKICNTLEKKWDFFLAKEE